jgi:hypothetical protein
VAKLKGPVHNGYAALKRSLSDQKQLRNELCVLMIPKRLHHPSIVELLGFIVDPHVNKRDAVVMECCGGTLAERSRR